MTRPIAFFVVVALFLAGSFGMSMIMNSASGGMQGCPFMNGGSICPMDIAGHIAQWHSLFSATIPSEAWLALAVVFASIAFAVSIVLAFRNRYSFDNGGVFFRSQPHQDAQEKLRILFVALFSNGILHPKRYA